MVWSSSPTTNRLSSGAASSRTRRSCAASTSWNSSTQTCVKWDCQDRRRRGSDARRFAAPTTRSSKSVACRAASRASYAAIAGPASGGGGRPSTFQAESQVSSDATSGSAGASGDRPMRQRRRAARRSGSRSATRSPSAPASMRTRRANAWSVRTSIAVAAGTKGANRLAIRARSSSAASLLKVITAMRSGETPFVKR